jgi:hypothetical protein
VPATTSLMRASSRCSPSSRPAVPRPSSRSCTADLGVAPESVAAKPLGNNACDQPDDHEDQTRLIHPVSVAETGLNFARESGRKYVRTERPLESYRCQTRSCKTWSSQAEAARSNLRRSR